MEKEDWFVIGCIVLILVLIHNTNCKEGLVSKPTDADISQYSKEVLQNRELFNNSSFYNARKKMPWMDAIAYEEIRLLAINNKLNNQTINSIFQMT
jgi:hypothetical protein